jgi:hypothetical protein
MDLTIGLILSGLETNLLYWKKMDDNATGWFCRTTIHQINNKNTFYKRTFMTNNGCLDSGTSIRRKYTPSMFQETVERGTAGKAWAHLEDATDLSRGASVRTEENG